MVAVASEQLPPQLSQDAIIAQSLRSPYSFPVVFFLIRSLQQSSFP